MNRAVAIWMSIAVSCVGGICCAQLAARSVVLRDKLGIIFGHGHLLALAHGRGIYQSDVDRRLAETHYPAGSANGEVTKAERQSALTDLIANAALVSRAKEETIPRADVKQELNLPDLQVKYVPVNIQNRMALVANGTVDIECGSTVNTLGRQKQVDFTLVTFVAADRVMAKKDANIKEIEDLAGKVAIVPQASTSTFRAPASSASAFPPNSAGAMPATESSVSATARGCSKISFCMKC